MLVRTLSNALDRLGAQHATRLIVACSGGLDSTVLLHALVSLKPTAPVVALHVNHGLQDAAPCFQEAAIAICDSLAVPLAVHQATIEAGGSGGPEATARDARYSIFETVLEAGDCLLSAHHQDDQTETFLLNLMRASGPRGLSGVPERRALGHGFVLRPLLAVSRTHLRDYADDHGLFWADDPSNTDTRFDRNFVRQDVLPLLESRFPSAGARIARSAALQLDAQRILDEVADEDLERVGSDPARLSIAGLRSLSLPRQMNVLRACVRELGFGEPGFSRTQAILEQLLTARDDAQPLIQWSQGEARRYRDHVYLLPPLDAARPVNVTFKKETTVELGSNGRLYLQAGDTLGIDPALCDEQLQIRYRVGGERLRPLGDSHQRALKHLLQTQAVVPWMRDRIPLVFSGDRLLAVADLWLNQEFCAANGLQPVWTGKPPLY